MSPDAFERICLHFSVASEEQLLEHRGALQRLLKDDAASQAETRLALSALECELGIRKPWVKGSVEAYDKRLLLVLEL